MSHHIYRTWGTVKPHYGFCLQQIMMTKTVVNIVPTTSHYGLAHLRYHRNEPVNQWWCHHHPPLMGPRTCMKTCIGDATFLGYRIRTELATGGPTKPDGYFLTPFMPKSMEMALPVPNKTFLPWSPDTVMLFAPFGCTHPPPPVPPFLLSQNLSSKDIAGSHMMKLKVLWRHLALWALKR